MEPEPDAKAEKKHKHDPVVAPVRAQGAALPDMRGVTAGVPLFARGVVQPKLIVSQHGDPAEEEAERVADAVISMAAPARPCEPEQEATIQARVEPAASPELTPVEEAPIHALQSGGEPLPDPVRAFFELRFGTRFSNVRVHTDRAASESARAIHARAYTLGQHVVFGAGQYAPESAEGRRLLAHELTHVAQQATSEHHTLQRQEETKYLKPYPTAEGRLGMWSYGVMENLDLAQAAVLKGSVSGDEVFYYLLVAARWLLYYLGHCPDERAAIEAVNEKTIILLVTVQEYRSNGAGLKDRLEKLLDQLEKATPADKPQTAPGVVPASIPPAAETQPPMRQSSIWQAYIVDKISDAVQFADTIPPDWQMILDLCNQALAGSISYEDKYPEDRGRVAPRAFEIEEVAFAVAALVSEGRSMLPQLEDLLDSAVKVTPRQEDRSAMTL